MTRKSNAPRPSSSLGVMPNMERDEWAEFIDTVKDNVRPHAGYFSCLSDRDVEELGVVQSLHESLTHHGQNFFHSYQSLGRGNDPPDCEAKSNSGHRIGIEVTELVDGASIAADKAAKSGQSISREPFCESEVFNLVAKCIKKKDNSKIKGGTYDEYVLIIYCDEPRMLDYGLIQSVRCATFPKTNLIDRIFLLFSYSPWEKCCPYIELKLSGV